VLTAALLGLALPALAPAEDLPAFPTLPQKPAGNTTNNLIDWSQGATDYGMLPPYRPGVWVEGDCFFKTDLAVVFPHLSSLLTAPVSLGNNAPTPVTLRNAHLDPTVAPWFELGAFRFGPGYGELALAYHFLASEGTECARHSRLNLQTVDLDYLSSECDLGNGTGWQWQVGVRLQVVFFDTQARGADCFAQARNSLFAAGPHAGFTLTQSVADGWAVFGRADVGLLGAYNTTQNFVVARDGLTGAADQEQSQFAPSVAAQAGVGWTPNWLPNSCLRAGYQFEQWYNLGRVHQSQGDLYAHGVFVSWEWHF
jgi:hypothetical protein